MTNYEWLLQMEGAARKEWFDAEHVEPGHSEAYMRGVAVGRASLDEEFEELGTELVKMTAERDAFKRAYEELRGKVLDKSDELYHIASCDGGVA